MPLPGIPAYKVLDSARTHLNDENGYNWTDARLFPKLVEAHRELQAELLLAGIPVIDAVSTIITVPAAPDDNTQVDLSTIAGYPTNIIVPIWMKERQVGQQNVDFVDMREVDFLPSITKGAQLQYWCWIGEVILLLGAVNNTQVQLRYRAGIPIPQNVNDSIGFLMGEIFLSYRTAALAAGAIGDKELKAFLTAESKSNLDKIVRLNIKQRQNLPAKRRPYHRRETSYAPLIIGGVTTNAMSQNGWYVVPIISNLFGSSDAQLNLSFGLTQQVNLNSSRTINVLNPLNFNIGDKFTVVLFQDSTGGNQVSFGSYFIGVDPTQFDTTANLCTMLTFGVETATRIPMIAVPYSFATI